MNEKEKDKKEYEMLKILNNNLKLFNDKEKTNKLNEKNNYRTHNIRKNEIDESEER